MSYTLIVFFLFFTSQVYIFETPTFSSRMENWSSPLMVEKNHILVEPKELWLWDSIWCLEIFFPLLLEICFCILRFHGNHCSAITVKRFCVPGLLNLVMSFLSKSWRDCDYSVNIFINIIINLNEYTTI